MRKITELQNSIELNRLGYKNHKFDKATLSVKFLRDIYANNLPIENTDIEQSNLFKRLNNLNKCNISAENYLLWKVKNLLKARENILNSFRNNVFPIINATLDTKPDTTPDTTPQQSIFYMPKQTGAKSRISKTEISPFKLKENFASKIRIDQEKLNTEIFKKYFGYQNPSFLAKYLFKANQVINDQIVSLAIYSNNELRNAVIRKEIPENENPKKVIHIIEKVLEFNN